jgi:hypothetical protein
MFFYFKKAFDPVNYWKLYSKLLDYGIPEDFVTLLSYWYTYQEVNVRWHNTLSDSCSVEGGDILWPYILGIFESCWAQLLTLVSAAMLGAL